MSIGLIGEQHVAKRRKPSSLDKYTQATYSAGVRSPGFSSETRQHPSRRPARKNVPPAQPGSTENAERFMQNIFGDRKIPAARAGETASADQSQNPTAREKPRAAPQQAARARSAEQPGAARRQGAGFSIPLSFIRKITVAAGIVVVALIALNWEDLPQNVSVSRRFPLEPGADMTEVERKLSAYTNTLLPGAAMPAAENSEIPLDSLTQTLEWTSYRVKKGDTVSGIARKFSLSKDAIIAANNISNARRLKANIDLRIPNLDGIPYIVKEGDNLEGISQALNVPLNVLLDANGLHSTEIKVKDELFIPGARMTPNAMKLALGEAMIYPVQGRLTDGYGWRNDPISGQQSFHYGIDLAANTGTQVQSVMDGTVTAVGVEFIFGNYVVINHGGGYQSLYAHLSTVAVKKGMRIKQGEKIGEVGSTGYSTGPHLHFAVSKGRNALNPLELLQK